jgi:predicted transcriptional regulator
MDTTMVKQLARLFGFNNGITIDLNIDEIKVDHEWAKAKIEAEIAELRYKEALEKAKQGGSFVMSS